MKFEFIEKEKPKKIWVNEKEAEKYLQALIMANPICFREYIAKVKADAIDEVRNLITQKLQTECHFKYCDDSDDCCEVNALMWLDEQLKEKHNEQS